MAIFLDWWCSCLTFPIDVSPVSDISFAFCLDTNGPGFEIIDSVVILKRMLSESIQRWNTRLASGSVYHVCINNACMFPLQASTPV